MSPYDIINDIINKSSKEELESKVLKEVSENLELYKFAVLPILINNPLDLVARAVAVALEEIEKRPSS